MPLLRFSTPRDPQLIAQFVRTRVIRPESQVWLAGLTALRTWHQQHQRRDDEDQGHIEGNEGQEHDGGNENRGQGHDGEKRAAGPVAVPLDARVGPFPLGQWVSEQRRAHRAGTLAAWRIELLEEAGMVWSVPDAQFEENLAAARAYFAVHGTLCAPRTAVAQGKPVGQWLTNCRRPGGLGKDPQRAAERAARLAEIDPDWNPAAQGWTVDWQRHYAKVRACLHGGATPGEIRPGVTVGGEDVGLWLARQRTGWEQLADGQRELLTNLGIQPTTPTVSAPGGQAEPGNETTAWAVVVPADATAWDRGLAALRQYQAREGHTRVPRKWIEAVHDDTGHQHPIKLGVWLSNTKSRRAKLAADKLRQLAKLGLKWAA